MCLSGLLCKVRRPTSIFLLGFFFILDSGGLNCFNNQFPCQIHSDISIYFFSDNVFYLINLPHKSSLNGGVSTVTLDPRKNMIGQLKKKL